MAKQDRRGAHWREKVAAGKGPECFKHNAMWAECAYRVETELNTLLVGAGMPWYVLPWKRRGIHIIIGNSGKVLFMQLLIHHINKVVLIDFSDGSAIGHMCDSTEGGSFMGIQKVTILQLDAFNSANKDAYGAIRTMSWVREHLSKSQIKTATRLWNSTGLTPMGTDGLKREVYVFHSHLRQKHLDSNARLMEERSQKRHKPAEPPATSISFLLCSPEDIRRQDGEI